ncbi:MAG: hypothetical protein KJZ93_27940 [Caldilineaceae bacterium]|nr:hypothetical protein [Caldilineaceae bacterium]
MFTAIVSHEPSMNARHHARVCFDRCHQQGWQGQLWRKLLERQEALLNLHEVAQSDAVQTRSHAGVRLVPIDQVLGSEGRCDDFDRAFRPLKRLSDERWISIFCARDADVSLPLVELIQVNDRYFVRDGHHRISVARWLGQKEIEAEVTVWRCRESQAGAPTIAQPVRSTKRRQPPTLLPLLRQTARQLVSAFQKLPALVHPAANQPAIQGG